MKINTIIFFLTIEQKIYLFLEKITSFVWNSDYYTNNYYNWNKETLYLRFLRIFWNINNEIWIKRFELGKKINFLWNVEKFYGTWNEIIWENLQKIYKKTKETKNRLIAKHLDSFLYFLEGQDINKTINIFDFLLIFNNFELIDSHYISCYNNEINFQKDIWFFSRNKIDWLNYRQKSLHSLVSNFLNFEKNNTNKDAFFKITAKKYQFLIENGYISYKRWNITKIKDFNINELETWINHIF